MRFLRLDDAAIPKDLSKLEKKISGVSAAIAAVNAAPCSPEEVRARLRADLEHQFAKADPQLQVERFGWASGAPASLQLTLPLVIALAGGIEPAIELLTASQHLEDGGLTDVERLTKRKALQADLAQLAVTEEMHICTFESETGAFVIRREDFDPRLTLAVWDDTLPGGARTKLRSMERAGAAAQAVTHALSDDRTERQGELQAAQQELTRVERGYHSIGLSGDAVEQYERMISRVKARIAEARAARDEAAAAFDAAAEDLGPFSEMVRKLAEATGSRKTHDVSFPRSGRPDTDSPFQAIKADAPVRPA